MNKKLSPLVTLSALAVFGLSLSFNANAEITPSDPKSPIQERDAQVTSEKQAQAMTSASLQVLGLIDQGKSGEVWDGLSPAIKPLVSRNSFVQRIIVDQSNFGVALKRERVAAYRSDANGQNNIPKGTYYSVVFTTNFSKGQGRELVSFRLDNDQIWRVAGYSLTRATSK